jgi:AraC family transcriptional regulator
MPILIDHPTPRPLPHNLELICPELGTSNVIALTRPDTGWSPSTQGTLSIKCAFGGEETYVIDGARMTVGNGRYLIVNQGQRYESEVSDTRRTESFGIFFRPGFAEETLHSMVVPDDRLLNDPEAAADSPVYFLEMVYRPDAILTPAIDRLHRSVTERTATMGWLEEQYHDVLARMLQSHRNVLGHIAGLPVVRRSTRIELYRRLARARDFMEAGYTQPIGLADMAEQANMAQHHFLRLFKKTFGRTPHQYLTNLRIERACRLLAQTELTVTQICYDLGFESPPSFALLFRRHMGVTPTEFRMNARHGLEISTTPPATPPRSQIRNFR